MFVVIALELSSLVAEVGHFNGGGKSKQSSVEWRKEVDHCHR